MQWPVLAPTVSFVVPSLRERRPDLVRCLAALARECRDAGLPGEALPVVEDAAAADGLAALATPALAVRPVLQPGGAARRRNAAFRVLGGALVALVDDDAEAQPGYGGALAELAASLAAGERAPGVVQGAVWPAFEVPPPDELREVLFRVGGFNRLGDLRRTDVFISANAVFPRAVLERVGPMREDLGPGSGGVPWGDDTEWHARATAAGFPTEFEEALAVRHRVQAERLTLAAVLERAERVGRTRARLEWDGRRPGLGVLLFQRALAGWAAARAGRGAEARCLARRLAGYAAELARMR
jgi:hypothetical protein